MAARIFRSQSRYRYDLQSAAVRSTADSLSVRHGGCILSESRRAQRRTVSDLSLIHISEPTRLLSISYAVFCLKKKKKIFFFFFLMIRRPPRSTLDRSSAASDVYKRQMVVASYRRVAARSVARYQ